MTTTPCINFSQNHFIKKKYYSISGASANRTNTTMNSITARDPVGADTRTKITGSDVIEDVTAVTDDDGPSMTSITGRITTGTTTTASTTVENQSRANPATIVNGALPALGVLLVPSPLVPSPPEAARELDAVADANRNIASTSTKMGKLLKPLWLRIKQINLNLINHIAENSNLRRFRQNK